MAYLSWIDDASIIAGTSDLLSAVDNGAARVRKDLQRNVVDPFSAVFSMAIFGLNATNWKKAEVNRQIDKTLSNAVGIFHQYILSRIPGWKDLRKSNQVDVVNESLHIIAEIKNKYNTVSGGDFADHYKKLSALINNKSSIYKDYTAYFVNIIPKTPQGMDAPFIPSDRTIGSKCYSDDKIRIIDGHRFYALASGEENALQQLFDILPTVIADISGKKIAPDTKSYVNELFAAAFGKK